MPMSGDVGDVGNLEDKSLIYNDFNNASTKMKDANIAKNAKISILRPGIHDPQTRRGECACASFKE